jgi:metal-responsive CopG/Arc/MetJ family transcriptional regulator
MTTQERQPITARIQDDLASYLEEYRSKHKLATRTDALEEAIRALKQRERNAELLAGYRQEALDQAKQQPDPWIDSDLQNTLQAIDRG